MVVQKNTSRVITPDVGMILAWREELIQLNDELFFDLMRMYLSDIKTPFSKEKLVESLSSFLRKDSTQNAIKKRISAEDKIYITAISLIPEVTLEKLTSFFNGTISPSVVYNKIVNLQERLIIFIRKGKPEKNESEDLRILALNPLLPFLKSCVEPSFLLPSFCDKNNRTENLLSNSFFDEEKKPTTDLFLLETIDLITGTLIKLLVDDVDAVKQDGKIKKRFRQTISEKIPLLKYDENQTTNDVALFLLDGIQRLGLVVDSLGQTEPNGLNLSKFSQLSNVDRFLYLFIASSLNLTFDKIISAVCFVSSFIKIIFDKTCTREDCFRILFLLKEKFLYAKDGDLSFMDSFPKTSRLSSVLQRQRATSTNDTSEIASSKIIDKSVDNSEKDGFSKIKEINFNEKDFDKIITNGILFGVFEENNKRICVSSQWKAFSEETNESENKSSEGSILIDSTGTVTIFPSINLADYLSVISFLDPETIQTAGIFSITKKSVQQAFSRGEKPEDCTALLKKLSGHDLPQNLEFSFADWYRSWQGALLYSGIVLCIEESRIAVVEQNPQFKKLCKKKLANGVYLMNSQSRSFVAENLKSSGIEVFDPPESSGKNNFSGAFSKQKNDTSILERRNISERSETCFFSSKLMPSILLFENLEKSNEVYKETLVENNFSEGKILSNEELLQELNTLEISEDIKTALNARINRNVILFSSQLDSRSVRFQKLEANAMDFSGKLRLIKYAISEQSKLEITYLLHEGKESAKENTSGFAVSIEYKMGDEIVFFKPSEKIFDNVELILIPLSQITFVKLIPNSIFFKVNQSIN